MLSLILELETDVGVNSSKINRKLNLKEYPMGLKIILATNNKLKLEEVNEIAKGCNIEFLLPPSDFDPIETGTTFEENSYIKAKEAAILTGCMALADDSGLCVEALNGAPGIHSARYAETQDLRIKKLLTELSAYENKVAKFVCCMTLVDKTGNILHQTIGECHGQITNQRKGQNGFGYDPIFIPQTYNQTLAELSDDEKNSISHRGNALRKMISYLSNL